MPKKIDMTGQKCGKLLVLYEATRKSKKEPIKWVCQCECGNQTQVRTTDLRNGHTASCGKCKYRKKDIKGQRFGKVVVLEEAPSDSQGNAVWKCKCDCGKEFYTLGTRLRNGNTTSCGCIRINKFIEFNKTRALDLTNQRFGELVAIAPTEKREGSKVVWKCQCSCGKEIYVSSSNLTTGNTKSCGCLKISLGENRIVQILTNNNVNYETQKTFSNLSFENGYKARFDFYLPNYNTIIEYDGKQHFIQGNGVFDNEEKFAKTQEHDFIKNEYCKNNNITLIRIPYTHYDNISLDDLLPASSKFIVK